MEVEMMLSSAFEDIFSPHDLATAIGIPHGAKLRLYRDNTGGQRAVTKIIVHCDKPTASRLRRRFSTSRAYVHDGRLASLNFVGMRPVVAGHHFPAKALLLHQGIVAVASTAQIEHASFPSAATAHTISSSLGVEAALEMIDRDKAADLRVPGLSDLYREFQRGGSGTHDDLRGVGARRGARRRGRVHANEEKTGRNIARGEEGKVSDEAVTRSREEYDGCSSSEMKQGSSTDDSFIWDDGRRVGHGETVLPRGTRRHNRRRRHRRHSRAWSEEEEGDRNSTIFLAQQRNTAAHRHRWHQQRHQALACTTRSVADMASALIRTNQKYPDAPRPVERAGIVSILAKLYADGAAFAGNRQRDIETLDRLGVTQWGARIYPNLFLQETMGVSEIGRHNKSKKAREGWFRLLGHVIALVRNVADFGMFVQVYVAAVERDRLRTSSTVAVVTEGSCTRPGRKDRGRRVSSTRPHLGASDDDDDDNDDDYDFRQKARRGSSSMSAYRRPPQSRIDAKQATNIKARDPFASTGRHGIALGAFRKGADADAGEEITPRHGIDEIPQLSCLKLRWLYPAGHGDSGGRTFARHTICGGGGVHGLVTLEAAAAIIRDAGRYVCMERVWRWFCDNKLNGHNTVEAGAAKSGRASSGRGHFLQFEGFVEMCDGLREHMEDVPIMSDDAQSSI